jgi:hypothetical protein
MALWRWLKQGFFYKLSWGLLLNFSAREPPRQGIYNYLKPFIIYYYYY